MTLPANIEPSDVTVIVDTREQRPLDLSPMRTEVGTLQTGDYAIKGLEHVARVERKSLEDLLGSLGRDRERFEREVERLLAFPVRVLVVESDWPEIEIGQWRSMLTPKQVIGSLLGFQAAGLAVHMCGNHERAGTHVARLLFTVARRRYRELRAMVQA